MSSRVSVTLTSFARDCARIHLGYDPAPMQVIAVSRRETRTEIRPSQIDGFDPGGDRWNTDAWDNQD